MLFIFVNVEDDFIVDSGDVLYANSSITTYQRVHYVCYKQYEARF